MVILFVKIVLNLIHTIIIDQAIMVAAAITVIAETIRVVLASSSSSPGQKNSFSLPYSSRRILFGARQSSQDFLGYPSPSYQATQVVWVSWQTETEWSQYSPGGCWAEAVAMAAARAKNFIFNLIIIIMVGPSPKIF